MAGGETLSSKLIFSGRAVRLRVDTVRMSDGRETTREIVEHDDCVAVVAVDGDDLLLVKQFREAVGKEMLEIPAGGIDQDEMPEDAVRREMREETGFLPGKVVHLGGFYSSPGYADEYLHLYLATDLVSKPLRAEDTDSIVLVRMKPEEVMKALKSGGIVDAKSIAGLFSYFEYIKTH